jgi:hypothetical protein
MPLCKPDRLSEKDFWVSRQAKYFPTAMLRHATSADSNLLS